MENLDKSKKIDQKIIDDFMRIGEQKPINIDRDNVNKTPTKMIKIENYDFRLNFGKYEGKTIGEIVEINPSYLIWLNDNHIRGIFISNYIMNKALENIDKEFFNAESLGPLEDDLPF